MVNTFSGISLFRTPFTLDSGGKDAAGSGDGIGAYSIGSVGVDYSCYKRMMIFVAPMMPVLK